jgi:hypothetical protein
MASVSAMMRAGNDGKGRVSGRGSIHFGEKGQTGRRPGRAARRHSGVRWQWRRPARERRRGVRVGWAS